MNTSSIMQDAEMVIVKIIREKSYFHELTLDDIETLLLSLPILKQQVIEKIEVENRLDNISKLVAADTTCEKKGENVELMENYIASKWNVGDDVLADIASNFVEMLYTKRIEKLDDKYIEETYCLTWKDRR